MTLNNSQGLLTWAADIGFRLFRDQRHISVSVKVSPLRRATTRVAFATLGLSRHADPDRSPGSALYLEARKILASNHKLHRSIRVTIAKALAGGGLARAARALTRRRRRG